MTMDRLAAITALLMALLVHLEVTPLLTLTARLAALTVALVSLLLLVVELAVLGVPLWKTPRMTMIALVVTIVAATAAMGMETVAATALVTKVMVEDHGNDQGNLYRPHGVRPVSC